MTIFTKHYFSTFYGQFDRKNPSYKLGSYRDLIVERLPGTNSNVRILDVGCGYGSFLNLLESENKFKTYGVDIGSYAIREAKKRTVKTKFWVGDIVEFQPKVRFDVVCAFDVLEHITDLRKALKKVHKLLAKNGHFLCVVPVYDGILGKVGGLLDKDETHVHKKSRKYWMKMLGQYFTILRVEGIIRYYFPLGYIHIKSSYLADWGQAILVSMSKKE